MSVIQVFVSNSRTLSGNRYYDEKCGVSNELSIIIVDSDFNKLIIAVCDSTPGDHGDYTWSPSDGLVIAAPAENRIEAVNITKELFSKYLNIPETDVN